MLIVIHYIITFCELIGCLWIFFFFSSRRRHTRLQGDWSSDVCSSDLSKTIRSQRSFPFYLATELEKKKGKLRWDLIVFDAPATGHGLAFFKVPKMTMEIDRKSVV